MKRISAAVLILSACFASRAWGQKPTCGVHTPWTEFHRTNMERWNPGEKVLSVKTVRNLKRKWSYSTGNYVESSPAVANGVVYIGSDDDHVYALNAKTGRKLWRYAAGSGVGTSPVVANGMMYVGSDDFKVYAFGLK